MPNLLVTGKWGEPHVTSAQQRNYNAGIAGDGQYVMSGMTATMTNSNACHIDPGVASFNGADVEVPAGGVDLTIENGTQGQKRNDLVVLRYTKNAGSQVEDVSLAVIKGTPTSGTATDPAHNEGSILDGDSPCDMPLWRIPLNGIDVGDPVKLFKDFSSISDLRETISHGEWIQLAEGARYALFGDWGIVQLRSYNLVKEVWTQIGSIPVHPSAGVEFYAPIIVNGWRATVGGLWVNDKGNVFALTAGDNGAYSGQVVFTY